LVGLIALSALEALSAKKLCVIPVDAQKFCENFFSDRESAAAAAAKVFFGCCFGGFRFFLFFKKNFKKILKNLNFIFLN
jgi:hypothetical protein